MITSCKADLWFLQNTFIIKINKIDFYAKTRPSKKIKIELPVIIWT